MLALTGPWDGVASSTAPSKKELALPLLCELISPAGLSCERLVSWDISKTQTKKRKKERKKKEIKLYDRQAKNKFIHSVISLYMIRIGR